MEFADNFDLMMLVRKKKDSMQYIREEDIWRIFIQILNGLFTLHQHDIVHRDLKVSFRSVLVSMLCNFGFFDPQRKT
jgi:serine/threonine protein kinase